MSANILFHFHLDPASRRARLLLGELGVSFDAQLLDGKPDDAKLLELNPAGEVPILHLQDGFQLKGSWAIEGYVLDLLAGDEKAQKLPKLLPTDLGQRAEIRRLCGWVANKLAREALDIIVFEKITKQAQKLGQPDPAQLRIATANLAVHLAYFAYLLDQRRWLAGDELSLADFYLGASISVLDYLGEIEWADQPQLKQWYAAIKSRPSMRDVLKDRWVGMLPVSWYDDLDF